MGGPSHLFADLLPAHRVIIQTFLAGHGAQDTQFTHKAHQTKDGLAIEFMWSETVWAWLWLEGYRPQFACGWPTGSITLDYPRTSRDLRAHLAQFRTPIERTDR